MKQRQRIYHSAAHRAEIWDWWQRGDSMRSIGRRFDRQSSSIFLVLSTSGGRPAERERSVRTLTAAERKEISRGAVAGRSMRGLAAQLGREPSTISREIGRNGGRAPIARRCRIRRLGSVALEGIADHARYGLAAVRSLDCLACRARITPATSFLFIALRRGSSPGSMPSPIIN